MIFLILKRRFKQAGIILIEVLFSALILGILVGATIYGLQITLSAFKRANDFTRSIYLAETLLFEEVKNPGSIEEEGQFPFPNDDFRWELERYPSSDDKNVIMAKVRIWDRFKKKTYAELVTVVDTRIQKD